MCDAANNNTQSIADYLAQLLKDKKQLAAFPNVFLHVERLLDDGKTPLALRGDS
jgi:protein quaking